MGVGFTDARPAAVTPLKILGSTNFSGAEAQVIGLTLPANYLRPGSTFRFTAGGKYAKTEPPISSGQAIARLRIGAASLTGGIVAEWAQAIKSTAAASIPFMLQGMLSVSPDGTSCGGWVNGRLFAPDPLFDWQINSSVGINPAAQLVMELTYVAASSASATFATASIERVSEILPPNLV